VGHGAQLLRPIGFPRGVRARLIDKDQQPRWNLPTLAQVSETKLNDYFPISMAKADSSGKSSRPTA